MGPEQGKVSGAPARRKTRPGLSYQIRVISREWTQSRRQEPSSEKWVSGPQQRLTLRGKDVLRISGQAEARHLGCAVGENGQGVCYPESPAQS